MKSSILFFIVLSLGVSLSFTSCEDKGEDQTINPLGQEISSTKISQTINEIQNKYTKPATSITVGDFVEFDDTYKVEVSSSTINTSTRIDILSKVENENHISITLKEAVTDFETQETITRENTLTFLKNDKNLLQENSQLPHEVSFSLMENNKGKRQSFHNLKVRHISVKAPKKWREQNSCHQCHLEAVEISYQVALWENEKEFEKVEVQEIILKDSSALASTYRSCISQLADFNGQRYYVRNCPIVLRDFNK